MSATRLDRVRDGSVSVVVVHSSHDDCLWSIPIAWRKRDTGRTDASFLRVATRERDPNVGTRFRLEHDRKLDLATGFRRFKAVFGFNRLVSNTTEMLGRIVGEDIEVVIGTTADLWKVRVDPGQVEQVLVNLAVNARDAMPNGGRLLLGTENLPRDHVAQTLGADASLLDYVVIVVADTGTGMSEETISHLFEPFYTTKEEGKGSGLGLATCHGIVSQNGGQIRVHSAPKLGTTFRIYWPRYHSDTATAPSVPPLATAFANKETILLVEDDDMVRRVAVRVLRNKGFSVISAASGIEAIEVATRHVGPIDLLLTDLVMPKMSGDKLAKELGPRRPEMRILFTSGYAEAAHDHGLGPGANFLQKPYLPQQLVERIRKVLDR